MENDLIRRSDALNCSHIVYIEYLETDDGGFIEGDADCIPVVKKRDIESIPAVDAVEVVRCRQCKNWETDWEPNYFNPDNPMYYCAETDIFPSGNWFCADGQRREEEDDG